MAVVQPRLTFDGERFVSVNIPSSVLVLYGLLMLVFIGGARFAVHALYERPLRGFRARRDARSVIIVGAGDGGRLLLREIMRNPELGYRPVGFIDDDPRKQGARIDRGLSVLGTTEQLGDVLEDVEPDEVLIAIPSAPGTVRARVVTACRERGVPVRTMPTVFELLRTGGAVMRQVRPVEVEDILGREPVRMDLDRVGGYLTGRVVLVTGAGGSIGSELCRQIARVGPSKLVLLDHAEDNLFAIRRELVEDRHVLNTVAVLADCKEGERMREVFKEHRPAIVFHAAAYKHVHLMEENPVEAVRNNALATRVMCQVAGESGTAAFVLVSTDKAVSPATVMGASKALAEWAVEAADQRYPETAFCAVRFGNVLGSSGSVVPIFRRQITAGGPLTVTHRDMTRYFMTIPEAVQLVIRAGSLVQGGEVFVLEMGEPVKILDLARDMIRLSGLEPDRDIAIEVIGPRPGEKLHEELFNPYERPQPTPSQKILRAEHPRARSRLGAGDVRRRQLARARRRRGRAGRQGGPSSRRSARCLRPSIRAPLARPIRLAAGTAPRLSGFNSMVWFAFSMEDQVEKYGAYVGIAAFFGLAVLSLLYFSQARELKRLREWAGRAPERAQELEQRVVAQAAASVAARRPAQAGQAAAGQATGTGTLAPPRKLAEMPAQTAAGAATATAVGVAEHTGTNGTGPVPALGPGGTVPAGRVNGEPARPGSEAPAERPSEDGAGGETRPFDAAEAAAATGAAAPSATPAPAATPRGGRGCGERRRRRPRPTPGPAPRPSSPRSRARRPRSASASPRSRCRWARRRPPRPRAAPAAVGAARRRPRRAAPRRAPAAAARPARSPCSSASPC